MTGCTLQEEYLRDPANRAHVASDLAVMQTSRQIHFKLAEYIYSDPLKLSQNRTNRLPTDLPPSRSQDLHYNYSFRLPALTYLGPHRGTLTKSCEALPSLTICPSRLDCATADLRV